MIINILTTAVTSCLQKSLLCLQTSSRLAAGGSAVWWAYSPRSPCPSPPPNPPLQAPGPSLLPALQHQVHSPSPFSEHSLPFQPEASYSAALPRRIFSLPIASVSVSHPPEAQPWCQLAKPPLHLVAAWKHLFWSHCAACGILVPWREIEPRPSTVT